MAAACVLTNRKRQKVRFLRHVVPAQRKLAALVRPDARKATAVTKAMRKALRARAAEEKKELELERRGKAAAQRRRELESAQHRRDNERRRKLRLVEQRVAATRPSSAKSDTTAGSDNRYGADNGDGAGYAKLAGTDLAERVRRRKRTVQSARRRRKESQQHARGFMTANNATSRHIAKGNAIRRQRKEAAAIARRVVRAKRASAVSRQVMKEAAQRRAAHQKQKIERSREEYKRMLIWRRNVDVQQLEMMRLQKAYDKDLRDLVRKVRRGELDQNPVWDVESALQHEIYEQRRGEYVGTLSRPMSSGADGASTLVPKPPPTSQPATIKFAQGPTLRKTVNVETSLTLSEHSAMKTESTDA